MRANKRAARDGGDAAMWQEAGPPVRAESPGAAAQRGQAGELGVLGKGFTNDNVNSRYKSQTFEHLHSWNSILISPLL